MYRLVAVDGFPLSLITPFLDCLKTLQHELHAGPIVEKQRNLIEVSLTLGVMLLHRMLTSHELGLRTATQSDAEEILLNLCVDENKKVAYAAVHWLGRLRGRGGFGVDLLRRLGFQNEEVEEEATITVRGAAIRALLAIDKNEINLNRSMLAMKELRRALVHWITVAQTESGRDELMEELTALDSLS